MRLSPAQVVMLDANGDMGLCHVASRPNLTFVQLDLFGPGALRTLSEQAAHGSVCVAVRTRPCHTRAPATLVAWPPPDRHLTAACPPRDRHATATRPPRATAQVGTHLCGSLSPRLIDLAVRSSTIDALVLCPCCLKGGFGMAVVR